MDLASWFVSNVENIVSIIWVPAILISALISVIMADDHRRTRNTISWFSKMVSNPTIGNLLDRMWEYVISFFFALFVVGILIFIGLVSKLLLESIGIL